MNVLHRLPAPFRAGLGLSRRPLSSSARHDRPGEIQAKTAPHLYGCLLWVLGLIVQLQIHATDIYFSPQGKGLKDGTSAGNAYAFNMDIVNGVNCLANLSLTDVTLHFAPDETVNGVFIPGDYLITQSFWLKGDLTRSIAIVGEVGANGVRPRFKLWPVDNYGDGWTRSMLPHWMIQLATTDGAANYLNRVVIENLELDGNFDAQGAWTSAANATGYKSFAIDVAASTGRIKNVSVRNFGSVGEAPTSALFPSNAGETFPVVFQCYDIGQSKVSPDPAPWVVEDVEVSDFHSVHSGYATLIMPIVFQPTHAAYNSSPVAIVRRCKVRDDQRAAIALGTAKAGTLLVNNTTINPGSFTSSGAIRFEDNIILNSLTGFNTDTGAIGPLWFTNNVFLDVGTWGVLGQPDSGINHKRYGLTDNLVRLRGRLDWKSYLDVCITDPNSATTDPNLALGRSEPRDASGLKIQGAAGEIYVERNDFTTWPLDNFNLPDPSDTSHRYHLIWKLMSGTSYYCWLYPRNRPDAQTVVFTTNRLSNVAFDFSAANATTLPTATYTTFGPSSAPAYEDPRTPSTTLPGGLVPQGRIGNVIALTNGSSRLIGVHEVQIGTVSYAGGSLTVNARLAKHQLAAGGTTGTVGVPGQTLRLQCIRRKPDWTIVTQTVTANSQTLADGTTTFTLTGLSGQSGVCRLTAWLDGGTGGSGTFESHQDAWAGYDYPLEPDKVGGLPVVELSTTIDVGDDKNTAPAKRAKIRATRNGDLSSSLAVAVRLESGVNYKPGSGGATDLAATYGTVGSADYYLVSGTGTWSTASPYTTGTLTIPAGAATGEISVVTRADNLTEQNLILCRLASSAAYAPGVSTNADILIFDGPEYSFYELSDYRPDTYGYQNPATVAVTAVNAASTVQAAGWVTYTASRYPVATAGGYWTATGGANIVDVWGTRLAGTSPLPYGISDPGMLVGVNGTSAFRRGGGAGQVALPNLQSSGGSSAAFGVNPAGTATAHYIAGQSVSGGNRPVVWVNGGAAPVNLTTGLGNDYGIGAAYAVNDAGVAVGESQGFVNAPGGLGISRPFRTLIGAEALTQQDYLDVPDIAGVDHSGRANAVTTTVHPNNVTKHHAAGRFRIDAITSKNAVYWAPSANGLPGEAKDLGSLRRDGADDSESEAAGINSSLRIVGWSGATSTSSDRRAVFVPVYYTGARWRDLNDRHFAFGQPAGWVLQAAVAINSGGTIAGTGVNSGGQTRGFLLVPRTVGQ